MTIPMRGRSRWLVLLACIIAAAAVLPGAAASSTLDPKAQETFADQLDAQLDQWVRGLAAQPGFEKFADADRSVMPLGPGNHGWLVALEDGDETIGYMVVHAVKEGGFQLTEYGLGEYIPYSEQTLRRSMAQFGLLSGDSTNNTTNKPFLAERLYLHPFYAVWRVVTDHGDVVYLDAVTGEVLPADDTDWQRAADDMLSQQQASLVRSPRSALRTTAVESFDPYSRMPWLTSRPLPWGIGRLEAKLKEGAEIRLTAETYDGAHRYVLPVIGLQVWNDGTGYIGLETDTSTLDEPAMPSVRFVSYAVVKPIASLYE